MILRSAAQACICHQLAAALAGEKWGLKREALSDLLTEPERSAAVPKVTSAEYIIPAPEDSGAL